MPTFVGCQCAQLVVQFGFAEVTAVRGIRRIVGVEIFLGADDAAGRTDGLGQRHGIAQLALRVGGR
ncbi:MAG: hypothetical protein KDE24_31055, partial [Caldilinea sp.]|nr:hypothetical protein [Caldilinea sp.]